MSKTCYVWKKNHENEQHLCLGTHSFTKLSHNICPKIHIFWRIDMLDVTARYGTSLGFIAFFLGIYIHYWQPLMSKVLYVSSPNFHTVCVWLMYTFEYVNMPNVTEVFRQFSSKSEPKFNLLPYWNQIFMHTYLDIWS